MQHRGLTWDAPDILNSASADARIMSQTHKESIFLNFCIEYLCCHRKIATESQPKNYFMQLFHACIVCHLALKLLNTGGAELWDIFFSSILLKVKIFFFLMVFITLLSMKHFCRFSWPNLLLNIASFLACYWCFSPRLKAFFERNIDREGEKGKTHLLKYQDRGEVWLAVGKNL